MAKKIYTTEEVTNRYDALPEEIKDLLYGFEMTSAVTKVGEKNGLHIDQMDRLNTETGYVMMGLTPTQDFPGIIAEDLGVDETKAKAIAQDIDSMLFAKVRQAMMKPSEMQASQAPTMPKPPLAEAIPIKVVQETPAAVSKPAAPAATAPAAPVKAPIPGEKLLEAAPKPDMSHADTMLTEPTVAKTPSPAAPATPPKPQDYKADPYREPVN